MSSPIPIVMCGTNPTVAGVVVKEMLPEYDGKRILPQALPHNPAIHIVLSPELGVAELPSILSGKAPSPLSPNNPGSGHYGAKPAAVALGGGCDAEALKQFKEACQECPGGTVWLSVDKTDTTGMELMEQPEKYAVVIAERLKRALGKLGVGQEGGTAAGEFLY